MAPYEVRFVNHGNHVFDTEYFEAESDARAIQHAHTMFRSNIGKGYEIWSRDRHVHTEYFR